MSRSILALIIVAGLLAGPLGLALGGCVAVSPMCDVICPAAALAAVPRAGVSISLDPTGRASLRPVLHPSVVVLAVPKPPPKPTSLSL